MQRYSHTILITQHVCYRTSSLPTYSNPPGLSVHSWTLGVWVKSTLCNTHSALSNTPAMRDLTRHIWGLRQQRICVYSWISASLGVCEALCGFIVCIRVHVQGIYDLSLGLKCESVCVCDGEGDCFRQVLKCNRLRHVACSVSCC